jgi:5-deoxy-D-glucuronate isomerase
MAGRKEWYRPRVSLARASWHSVVGPAVPGWRYTGLRVAALYGGPIGLPARAIERIVVPPSGSFQVAHRRAAPTSAEGRQSSTVPRTSSMSAAPARPTLIHVTSNPFVYAPVARAGGTCLSRRPPRLKAPQPALALRLRRTAEEARAVGRLTVLESAIGIHIPDVRASPP